jgi:small subunit ribosomal protein S16
LATRIRLARGGTKKRPFYRIVVADKPAPRDGRFIERLGSYNPLLEENKSTVDVERAKYWLTVGATPTERVRKLLTLHGVDVPEPKGKGRGATKAGAEA